jgi:hydrophobe/amphiphile efflux-1 (HAE1) family protein
MLQPDKKGGNAMKLKLFVDRPILAACVSLLILMLGIIGLVNLPMEQYPDIAPPTVQVSATYTGASAETVQKAVIVPLEEEINGVENMMYMTSSASNSGSATITVYFKQGTDPDMATVNVQNRVNKAQGTLPSEVTKIGVTAQKRQNSQLMLMSLYSVNDDYDEKFLANYLNINVVPRIQRISGVGEVMVMGNDYAMRIWLKPDVMAQYGLVPSDIISLLGEQNIETSTGTLGEDSQNTFQYTLKYRGRYETSDELGNIVVKTTEGGNTLHLKDVADIELGTTSYNFSGGVSGHPGATFMVMQSAGSNANEIIKEINKLADDIRADMPKGLVLETMMSVKSFLDASVKNVIKTLVEAILLVIIVVYVFLQSVRSTFIPLVGIVVSLVGTFAFLYVAGFSINLLTLFALVLVIGTVVDDSIVVVEAVQAKFDEGYKSPYKATIDAMGGITSAIITTSLVFMAVFIPVSFMGGTTGTFYTQFGLTMAVAVGFSALNALTTCPALCALIMTPHMQVEEGKKLSFSSRYHIAFDTAFSRIVNKYKTGVKYFFHRKWMIWTALALNCVLLFVLVKNTKTGLVPDEDTGTLFVSVTTSPGSTLAETQTIMKDVEKRINDIPQIYLYSTIGGYNMMGGGQSSAGGTLIVRLKDWNERKGAKNSKDAVMAQIMARTADIKNAQVFVFAPPMIMGYGMTNGLEVYVQDQKGGSIDTLFAHTKKFLAALNKRPEIQSAVTTFDTSFPQYLVEVDAARCKRAGILPSDVLDVLSCYVGGNYASNINRFSKIYRVMVQAKPQYRLNKESLNNMYVRSSSGSMAPIGQFITLTKTYGPEILSRFNLFSTISVNASPADGYSSGDAIEAVREVAKQTLPAGYGYEFGGSSREEASSGTSVVVIFIICVMFIYIILCSLYESLFVPLAVMLSIPFGLMGSFLFAKLFGMENNVYMQTGLIMLIGLLAKTAILVTEYASERRRQGMTIAQAALSAAAVRLRPILMTALTMMIGLFPLMVASGAGANGNKSLGVGTVGGMFIGTVSLLFVVPVLFIVFQTIEERVMPKHKH